MADDDHVKDIAIYKAALGDKWASVSKLFKDNPSLMTKRITQVGEMPLHIAVGTNSSHSFVDELVKDIVARGENHMLFKGNKYGNNPLHFAAMVGNMHATKLLLKHNPDKTQTRVRNKDGNMPLQLAAWHGNKETLEFLLKETPDLLPDEEGVGPYSGVAGGDLITRTIMAGFYDVALDIIEKHPDIVFLKDSSKKSPKTALEILAQKPESFASGRRLGLWGSFIYSLIPVKNDEGTTDHSKV
ncbi:hypothetical protein M8C21_001393 [Ambrosia artemisiifolia]|uniref:Uncharacterized protein n=1 Tax=Ambrosia artemisiifolia TaxID=4212 RepID=A0AAD5DAH7_AMBAR|nr:hypothetical protein M8C21_001393 [Ambrosia artemisiifolia]